MSFWPVPPSIWGGGFQGHNKGQNGPKNAFLGHLGPFLCHLGRFPPQFGGCPPRAGAPCAHRDPAGRHPPHGTHICLVWPGAWELAPWADKLLLQWILHRPGDKNGYMWCPHARLDTENKLPRAVFSAPGIWLGGTPPMKPTFVLCGHRIAFLGHLGPPPSLWGR